MGFNTMIASFLSVCHNATIWMVMSNHRLPAQLDFVSNSNFAVGILLGTTIGMTVLMLMISTYYGQLSKCEKVEDMTISQYMCEYKGAMLGVWFWGGLLFWMDLLLVVLLARGKDDLAIQENQYEDIGIGMESYNSTSSPPEGRTSSPPEGRTFSPPEGRKFGQAGTDFDVDFRSHQNSSASAQVLNV
eukprot:scaffold48084_cov61-Attheya_sp.AAC.6